MFLTMSLTERYTSIVNKTALKIALFLMGFIVLFASAYFHNRFLYNKATAEPIYASPLNLVSPYKKDTIKKSSYISLDKLQKAMTDKTDPHADPDAVYQEDFPKQELYPIIAQIPTLPTALKKHEGQIPSITRLHMLLYRDLACSTITCSAQKFAVVFPFLMILCGTAFFLVEHKNSFSHKKIVKLGFLGISSSAFVLIVFFVASLLVVVELKKDSLKEINNVVKVLNKEINNDTGIFYAGKDSIAVYLTVSKKAPQIYEPHNKQEIIALYLFNENKKVTFYQKYILLNSILENDYLSERLKPTLLLFDESKLVVYKYDKNDLAVLMPVLSKNIIGTKFANYNPKISRNIDFKVLNQIEYQEFQEKKEEELKAEVNKYIGFVQGEINKINSAIAQGKNYRKDIDDYMDEVDDLYNEHVKKPQQEYDKYCKDGYEDFFECRELKSIIETNKKRLRQAEKTLEEEKKKLEEFEKNAQDANAQLTAQLAELQGALKLINDNPVNTEYQKGVFFPGEMGIKLRYFDEVTEDLFQARIAEKESKSISAQTKLAYDYILSGYSKEPTFSQYLMTSLHEYLHAIAYYENYEWPDSLEESMTEYLSLEAGFDYVYDKSKLDRLVYTDNVQLLEKLLTKVDKKKMLELYFNDKTDKSLRNEFAKVYANYHYDTFKSDFNTLLYMNYDDIDQRKEFMERLDKGLTAQ